MTLHSITACMFCPYLVLQERVVVVKLPDEILVFLEQFGQQAILGDFGSGTLRLQAGKYTR